MRIIMSDIFSNMPEDSSLLTKYQNIKLLLKYHNLFKALTFCNTLVLTFNKTGYVNTKHRRVEYECVASISVYENSKHFSATTSLAINIKTFNTTFLLNNFSRTHQHKEFKKILEITTQYILQECDYNVSSIRGVVNSMVEDNEIYGIRI